VGALDAVAARVARGETVQFRPTGSSMVPLIRSRQLVTVAPVDPARLDVGDIVLARVAGTVYLHRVTAIAGARVQIGNNRGRINGWTSRERVFGLCVEVDGVPRGNAGDKILRRDRAEDS
jgi:hypothetical protein